MAGARRKVEEGGGRTEEGTEPRDVCVYKNEFTAVLNTLTKAIYPQHLDRRERGNKRTNTAILAENKARGERVCA